MTSRTIPLREVDRPDDVSRRTFVKLLGASMLAAASTSCAKPTGEIVPYVEQPPELVPGMPLHFATSMEIDGFATGLIAESREGRPVKIEGNPNHPASLGAAGVFEQASILQLYDPDRGAYITRDGGEAGWVDVAGAFGDAEIRRRAGHDGGGLRLLLEPTASPTILDLIARVRDRYPAMRVHYFAPLANEAAVRGAAQAIGRPAQPIYDFRQADVILAADADPMGAGPFHLRYARQIADRRRVRHASDPMTRLYAIEGRHTPTGIAADHRLALRPSQIPLVLAALLERLRAGASALRDGSVPHADWIHALADDLIAHRGRAVVVVGDRQPPAAHALGCALNDALGAMGTHLTFVEPILPSGDEPFASLVDDMNSGRVSALMVIGGNPSYNAPADVPFRDALRKVPLALYSGLYANETARDIEWYVPAAHYLESWGDARALDGTPSVVQPLIAPLHDGRSAIDILALLAGDGRPSNELVRDYWLAASRLGPSGDAWRAALRRGVLPNDTHALSPTVAPAAMPAFASASLGSTGTIEVALAADSRVHDGRFANIGWLQELPDTTTTLTWDNAAFMNAKTAGHIGVEASQLVTIASRGHSLRAPVFIEPGVADDLVVLPLGYGREGAERRAQGVGVNAYALWTSGSYIDADASASRATALGLPLVHDFAVVSPHWTLEGRPILLSSTLDRFKSDPAFTAEHKGPVAALYGAAYSSAPQWAMAIDLTVCSGCSACVVACQAENNVPVVGKSGVQQRHEMHWLRIDRYITDSSAIGVQPMLCQQCEDAPCEYVCPVNATVHSPDGLNEMVYNRCVGTRFCSNNCPYKVRRFNYLNYTSEMSETEKMAMNPDVTVRARGVMEKCTFCVQRLRRAEIDARIAGTGRPLAEVQTACQQACPTRAIVFGSIADSESQVTRDARADQSYRVLNDRGTRPRIHYLARLRNVNSAIPEETS